LVFRDTHRLVDIPQGVLDNQAIAGLAQKQPDGRSILIGGGFDSAFVRLVADIEEVEDVRVFEEITDEIRLGYGQLQGEVGDGLTFPFQ